MTYEKEEYREEPDGFKRKSCYVKKKFPFKKIWCKITHEDEDGKTETLWLDKDFDDLIKMEEEEDGEKKVIGYVNVKVLTTMLTQELHSSFWKSLKMALMKMPGKKIFIIIAVIVVVLFVLYQQGLIVI